MDGIYTYTHGHDVMRSRQHQFLFTLSLALMLASASGIYAPAMPAPCTLRTGAPRTLLQIQNPFSPCMPWGPWGGGRATSPSAHNVSCTDSFVNRILSKTAFRFPLKRTDVRHARDRSPGAPVSRGSTPGEIWLFA